MCLRWSGQDHKLTFTQYIRPDQDVTAKERNGSLRGKSGSPRIDWASARIYPICCFCPVRIGHCQGRYDHIVDEVNQFLTDKRLDKFDERTMELMVATGSGARRPVHLLSAGEKQVLLTPVYITRWLEMGGIILIDEPDLHLHVSLTRSLTSHLRRMVAQKGRQLIVASHEPSLWEQFTQSQRIELGSVAEVQQ